MKWLISARRHVEVIVLRRTGAGIIAASGIRWTPAMQPKPRQAIEKASNCKPKLRGSVKATRPLFLPSTTGTGTIIVISDSEDEDALPDCNHNVNAKAPSAEEHIRYFSPNDIFRTTSRTLRSLTKSRKACLLMAFLLARKSHSRASSRKLRAICMHITMTSLHRLSRRMNTFNIPALTLSMKSTLVSQVSYPRSSKPTLPT